VSHSQRLSARGMSSRPASALALQPCRRSPVFMSCFLFSFPCDRVIDVTQRKTRPARIVPIRRDVQLQPFMASREAFQGFESGFTPQHISESRSFVNDYLV
jgi:hypothetical protein